MRTAHRPLLLSDLERLPLEPAVLELIDRQLKSGISINGQVFHPGQGVLQGAVLSGALANLYLTEFDRLCLSSGLNLVRYGDDASRGDFQLGGGESRPGADCRVAGEFLPESPAGIDAHPDALKKFLKHWEEQNLIAELFGKAE